MDLHARAAELVGVLTTSVENRLQAEALASLKQFARLSSEATSRVFDAVMAAARKRHSQVRFLCLLIIDSLFMRSKDFRRLVVSSLSALLPLLLGYQPGNPLPAPQDRAELLKKTALECLKRWELAFGAHPHYVQLILAKRFVERSLCLPLPDLRERASRQERERRERRERTQALLSAKFESLRLEFPQAATDIQSVVNQVERCLELVEGRVGPDSSAELTASGGRPADLLHSRHMTSFGAEKACDRHAHQQEGGEQEIRPWPHAFALRGVSVEDSLEEASQGSLRSRIRQAALASVQREESGHKLRQTMVEMPHVFHTLTDLFRMVDNRFLPLTAAWIATLSRFEDFTRGRMQERDDFLKRAIDLRSALKRVHAQCVGAGLAVTSPDVSTNGPDRQPRSVASRPGAAPMEALGSAPGLKSGSEIGASDADGSGDEAIEWEGDDATVDMAGIQQPLQVGSGASEHLPPHPVHVSTSCSMERGSAGEAALGVGSGCRASGSENLRGQPSGHPGPHGTLTCNSRKGGQVDGEELSHEAQLKRARRQQLLRLAPELPWGQHLEYWGAAAEGVPVNPRGMSFENHWGPVDETQCLPQERVRELTLMVTTYKPPVPPQPAANQGTQPHRSRAAGSHPAGPCKPLAAGASQARSTGTPAGITSHATRRHASACSHDPSGVGPQVGSREAQAGVGDTQAGSVPKLHTSGGFLVEEPHHRLGADDLPGVEQMSEDAGHRVRRLEDSRCSSQPRGTGDGTGNLAETPLPAPADAPGACARGSMQAAGSGRYQSAAFGGVLEREGVRRKLPEGKRERRVTTGGSIWSHNDSVLAAAQDSAGAQGGSSSDAVPAPHGFAVSASLKKPSLGAVLRAMLKVPNTSAARVAARARGASKRRRSEGPECSEAARDLSTNQW